MCPTSVPKARRCSLAPLSSALCLVLHRLPACLLTLKHFKCSTSSGWFNCGTMPLCKSPSGFRGLIACRRSNTCCESYAAMGCLQCAHTHTCPIFTSFCRGGAAAEADDRDADMLAEGEPGAAAHSKRRRKRKRKPRYPKGFDPESPGPPPDPERWLPKHERSDFKRRKKGKAGKAGAASRGAQVWRAHRCLHRAQHVACVHVLQLGVVSLCCYASCLQRSLRKLVASREIVGVQQPLIASWSSACHDRLARMHHDGCRAWARWMPHWTNLPSKVIAWKAPQAPAPVQSCRSAQLARAASARGANSSCLPW